jgi:hypothetical protein
MNRFGLLRLIGRLIPELALAAVVAALCAGCERTDPQPAGAVASDAATLTPRAFAELTTEAQGAAVSAALARGALAFESMEGLLLWLRQRAPEGSALPPAFEKYWFAGHHEFPAYPPPSQAWALAVASVVSELHDRSRRAAVDKDRLPLSLAIFGRTFEGLHSRNPSAAEHLRRGLLRTRLADPREEPLLHPVTTLWALAHLAPEDAELLRFAEGLRRARGELALDAPARRAMLAQVWLAVAATRADAAERDAWTGLALDEVRALHAAGFGRSQVGELVRYGQIGSAAFRQQIGVRFEEGAAREACPAFIAYDLLLADGEGAGRMAGSLLQARFGVDDEFCLWEEAPIHRLDLASVPLARIERLLTRPARPGDAFRRDWLINLLSTLIGSSPPGLCATPEGRGQQQCWRPPERLRSIVRAMDRQPKVHRVEAPATARAGLRFEEPRHQAAWEARWPHRVLTGHIEELAAGLGAPALTEFARRYWLPVGCGPEAIAIHLWTRGGRNIVHADCPASTRSGSAPAWPRLDKPYERVAKAYATLVLAQIADGGTVSPLYLSQMRQSVRGDLRPVGVVDLDGDGAPELVTESVQERCAPSMGEERCIREEYVQVEISELEQDWFGGFQDSGARR